MAAKNRSQLRNDLRDEFKTDPNGKIWRNRELDRFLGRAYLKFQADCQFDLAENQVPEDSFNTVAGTQEYNLPTDFGRMELVTRSDAPLHQTTFEKIRRHFTSQTNNGQPSYYYIRGSKIGTWPIADAVYTIKRLYLAKLDFPGDDTTFIDYNDDDIAFAIIKYAAYLAWASPRGNRQTAIEKLDDYKEIVKSIKTAKQFRDLSLDYKTVRDKGNYFNPKGLTI